MTWYASNPPLVFFCSEASPSGQRLSSASHLERVERVLVTHASIGVLYLFLPFQVGAYPLLSFSLRLPSFRCISLYFTSLHLFYKTTSASTLIPCLFRSCQSSPVRSQGRDRNLPDATLALSQPQVSILQQEFSCCESTLITQVTFDVFKHRCNGLQTCLTCLGSHL